MEFLDSISQIRKSWGPLKQWDIEQQKKEKQNEELRKKYPPTQAELDIAKQSGRTIIDSINTMDQHSIDKSEDANLALGYKLLPFELAIDGAGIFVGNIIGKNIKNTDIKPYGGLLGLIIVGTIFNPVLQILQSTITKQASRVARFQTRENDLKNSRNFVVYTEEQMDEAKKLAKIFPDMKIERKDKFTPDTFNPYKTYIKAKQTTDELGKDDAKYKKWKEQYRLKEATRPERFARMNPSAEDLHKAQKQRDSILSTITKIETTSINYTNNMEMGGYIIKAIICNAFMLLGVGATKLLDNVAKNNNKVESLKFLPLILSSIAPIFILSPMVKLIKDSARIGRFKSKQELLSDPQNFISYDEDKRRTIKIETVEEKQNKSFIVRLKDDLEALKRLPKDAKEFNDYMDTKYQDELKLKAALEHIEISDEQKKEALILQKNAFHAFEKMDEQAQRFTDDSDAAVDSIKAIAFGVIGLSLKLLSLLICGKEIKKINNNKMPEKFWDAMKLTFTKGLTAKTAFGLMLPSIITPFIRIAFTAKGVQIKKDSGRIGIMTATKDLEDPRNFLAEEETNTPL